MRGQYPVALLVAGILAVACSGSNVPPVLPDTNQPASAAHSEALTKSLWGVWQIDIDTSTWEITATPLRGAQFTVDVVTFLQKPAGNPQNLSIKVTDVSEWLTLGLIDVDVTLRHPFPGLDEYTGFDVYGVFDAPGTSGGQYDGDVIYSNGVSEPILTNADGYTRWMNPVEFPSNGTIFRFVPGKLGTPEIGLFTSTVNGYKYFADGLEKDEDVADFFHTTGNVQMRGKFSPGSANSRTYSLKFPFVGGVPHIAFQYAVIASWIPPDKTLSGDPDTLDVPGDFGPEANASEAIYVAINDFSTLYYVDGEGGGKIDLKLEVFDWGALQEGVQVADEIHQMVIEGDPDVVPGGYVVIDQSTLQAGAAPGGSIISSVFEVEINGCTPKSQDDFPVLITIESEAPDKFDPGNGVPANDDRLAAYFVHPVAVADVIPASIEVISPNGGETLWMAMSCEITWDPGPGGIDNVKIEWSTDNFVSDIRTIIASTPNDGSYTWVPIPNVETSTARVRVSNVLGGGSDTSDGDFSIALPVWLDFQDEVEVSSSTVAFAEVGEPYGYHKQWDEFSPAISQDEDAKTHICWHSRGFDYIYGNLLLWGWDVGIRSQAGTSWAGENRFFQSSTGPSNDYPMREDNMKLASASNGYTFAAIKLFTIYFCCYVDSMINYKQHYYNSSILGAMPQIYSNCEIMADSDHLYMLGDGYIPAGNGPGIYSLRVDTPTCTVPWNYDPLNALTDNGEISHCRSWAIQDGKLALAFFRLDGQIRLLRQTDPTSDEWDDTEVIFNGSGYTDSKDPSIAEDGSDRLFAVWTGQETSSGEFRLLASMKETPTSAWTAPIIAATSSVPFDDQHISCSAEKVLLPTGDSEYMVVIGYETNDVTYSEISPKDLWAFLPAQQVSAEGDATKDPDTLCLESPYSYDALFVWCFEVDSDNWDVKFRNGDFETP